MAYYGNFPSAYNRSAYDQPININDANGNPFVLDNKTFVFEVADPSTGAIVLSATLANGKLTSPAMGQLRVLFTRSEMQQLSPKNYNVGLTWSAGDETGQIFAGILPVTDGVTA